jgi:hypothetical protein
MVPNYYSSGGISGFASGKASECNVAFGSKTDFPGMAAVGAKRTFA